MSQWRLNDDDFEDDDHYSKTNVEKKADAPWTYWSQTYFKVPLQTSKIDKQTNKQTNDDDYSKTNVEKIADAPWTH